MTAQQTVLGRKNEKKLMKIEKKIKNLIKL